MYGLLVLLTALLIGSWIWAVSSALQTRDEYQRRSERLDALYREHLTGTWVKDWVACHEGTCREHTI